VRLSALQDCFSVRRGARILHAGVAAHSGLVTVFECCNTQDEVLRRRPLNVARMRKSTCPHELVSVLLSLSGNSEFGL
jgi:hypothetical protein